MSDENKRDFKGVWIPKEIWLSKNLTLQEKVFYVEIDSLDNENGCFAENSHFAEFFGVSKTRVSIVINSLVKKGYITSRLIYKEGTKQILKRVLNICYRPSQTNVKEPIKQKFKDSNTFSNTSNNTFKNNNGSFTNELVSFSTYVNNLSAEEYTKHSESINSIEYFIHVREQRGFKECQYKSSTWEDILNDWLNVSDVDEKLTVDESYDIIDKFFETKFKDCDYSPVFYCSGKIKANRYYELRRNKGED